MFIARLDTYYEITALAETGQEAKDLVKEEYNRINKNVDNVLDWDQYTEYWGDDPWSCMGELIEINVGEVLSFLS